MIWRILADLVLLLHIAFIIFVIIGGFFARRWHWIPWLHLPAAAWGIAIEFGGWICPLTHLENWLRQAGGETGYAASCIEHYFMPIVYPAGLTPEIQIALALGVFLINIIAYSLVYRNRSKNH